jgi:membrane protein required for colicin V production
MPGWFDVIVGSIMCISVVMAFFRGFVKEFFTIISWILATIITIYLSPVIQGLFDASEGKKAFYDALIILAIFSLSMVLFSFVFGRVIHHLRKNDGLFLDRSLGVLFGFIRGGLFVCLGYIFVVGFIYDEKPEWIRGRSVKLVEIGSKQLMKLNPKNIEIDLDKLLPKKDDKEVTKSKKLSGNKNIKDKIGSMLIDEGDGYSDEIRNQVEQLISDDIL